MNEVPDRSPTLIDRRQALQRLALMLGGTLSASTLAGVLGGCRAVEDAAPAAAPAASAALAPAALSDAERGIVAALAELVIPETDTPGAGGAGVPAFIEQMYAGWLSEEERAGFVAGLADVDARARSLYGAGFTAATEDQQTAILRAVAEEAQAVLDAADSDQPGPVPFFRQLKELTLVGYYTSEVGMTRELLYQPATSAYEACISYSAVGRQWVS